MTINRLNGEGRPVPISLEEYLGRDEYRMDPSSYKPQLGRRLTPTPGVEKPVVTRPDRSSAMMGLVLLAFAVLVGVVIGKWVV